MDLNSFNELREIIFKKSGIALNDGKQSLVSTRIEKRLKELSLPNEKEYLTYLKEKGGEQELILLLDVITTNVTHFFREMEHFDYLANFLRQWHVEEGQTKFRIWSAASSSGEEPYSIAMTSAGALDLAQLDFKILATDLSTRILDKAMAGNYPKTALSSIPKKYQNLNFIENSPTDPERFAVIKSLRNYVSFGRVNLSVTPFPMKGPFDIIFCRNVMIYFEETVKQKLITEFERLLRPGGYLLIGHSENLLGLKTNLATVKPSIFRKAQH